MLGLFLGNVIDAAQSIGLRYSTQLRGMLEGINRINETDVTIRSWLVDLDGHGEPMPQAVDRYVCFAGITMRGGSPSVRVLLRCEAGPSTQGAEYLMLVTCH